MIQAQGPWIPVRVWEHPVGLQAGGLGCVVRRGQALGSTQPPCGHTTALSQEAAP